MRIIGYERVKSCIWKVVYGSHGDPNFMPIIIYSEGEDIHSAEKDAWRKLDEKYGKYVAENCYVVSITSTNYEKYDKTKPIRSV